MRSFYTGDLTKTTDLVSYYAFLTQNSSPKNIEAAKGQINDEHKYLLQKYFFNEGSTTIQTVGDQQQYLLPYNYSKLKTGTITIGELRWTPTEILSRQDWDKLNVFPYYSDIPNNFFIYGGYLNFWPIPSTGSTQITYTALGGTNNLVAGDTITEGTATGKILTVNSSNLTMQVAVTSFTQFSPGSFTTGNGTTGTIVSTAITPGNTITFNYKFRVVDMIFSDYVTGTLTATNASPVLTGSGTAWSTTFAPTPGNVQPLNLWIRITSPAGDGEWYQIQSVDSDTQITLLNTYQGASVAGAAYTIGQMPLLLEDFHNMCIYRPLIHYFTTINKDTEKAAEFQRLYDEGIKMLDDYVGSKALNVNLRGAVNTINPNLYPQNVGGNS